MTIYLDDQHKYRQNNDTPIVYGEEEWHAESRPPYICDFCHHTLIKLQDRSGLSISWYCNNCKSEYDPEVELRTKSKISMSEGSTKNPSVAYPPEAQLKRKKNEPRGSFRRLQERGIKITNYQERGWRKQNDE
jgi:hypothetical protein